MKLECPNKCDKPYFCVMCPGRILIDTDERGMMNGEMEIISFQFSQWIDDPICGLCAQAAIVTR